MNIALMYGGKSCEHDISIVTAKQVAGHLTDRVYEIYISREGQWLLVEKMKTPQEFVDKGKIEKLSKVTFLPCDKTLYLRKGKKLKPIAKIDAAVLCFHGVNGEDGTIQGLLELSDIPYTSCGVLASAVCMDKIVAKNFLKGLKIPVVASVFFSKKQFESDCCEVLSVVKRRLHYPVIVKPANLGSSIGISVCNNVDELENGLEIAFNFDDRVLVEKALLDFCDINVSVMRVDGKVMSSLLEKPVTWEKFLTFEDKYIGGSKEGASRKREFPYLTDKQSEIEENAVKIYEALDCKGVIRIDFLLDKKTDKVFVNEVNTIPGSMAFYLWDKKYDFSQLLKIQIDEGIKKTDEKNKLFHLFESNVLKNNGGKFQKRTL